ncbi:hypothetical protein GCK72_019523 [Caenorhabditis remanei]|uniref:Serpentine Receptor, class H n=1 Tax=Caenorhabditis remanei TaxID=31234 RepID=A0A6A5GCU8_CAERE|nr:hypothetical protein GCK72_019523 [Caenorhabditis remanei]KAF1752968.1 hypothetical protein GCK72_019523 [Caenorhabditis remanei]
MCLSGDSHLDTRYLASPEFIAFALHCVTVVEFPVMTYGAYCILFKTPARMNSVKWLMLNLHFWSSLSDFVISFIGIPYILLPAPAGYGLGLIDAPSLLIYCMVTFIAALAASVLAIYENRYFTLFGRNTFWKKCRKPFFVFITSLVPIIFVPPYFDIPEQTSARQIIISKIPCQPPFTYKNREMFVIALDYTIPVYSIAFGTLILAVSITIFGVLIGINLVKVRISSVYSSRTFMIQRKFAIALVIQSLFMLSVVLAPVLTVLWIIELWYHNQVLNNFVFITLSLHGIGSTIVMILVHRPYREFTFSKFSLCCKEVETYKSNVTVSVVL